MAQMNAWSKQTIIVRNFPVKVYVNSDHTQAILFYQFGRYSSLICHDKQQDVLDFVIDFLLGNSNNIISIGNYVSSFEDTAIIAA